MTDKPNPKSDTTPDSTTLPKGDQALQKGDQSLTSAIAAGALRKCQEEFNGDHAQAVCSANILRAFAKNGNDPTLTEKDGKFEFGPPNFARASKGDGTATYAEPTAAAVADVAEKAPVQTAPTKPVDGAPLALTPKDAQPQPPAAAPEQATDKPVVKTVTFDGQTGTQTSLVHKTAQGEFVSGTLTYDGVRASKDLNIDNGNGSETRRITGIKEQKFEADPLGTKLTLTTENGVLHFTQIDKDHWRQDAADAPQQPIAKTADPAVTSTTKEVTVGGQKGTETTSERRDAEGHVIAGSVSYDGVRVAKVVPVDTGSALEPHRFTGIQSSTVEQTANGVRMTLVTDSGNFSFTKTEKGWHAESDVSQVPLAVRAQTRGLPAPGLPATTDAAQPAPVVPTEAAPAPAAPLIPKDTAPAPVRPSDAAPAPQDAPTTEAPVGREQLIALQRQLMDQGVSNADKLKAVHALHDAGVEQFQLKDADGTARTYTIKEEPLGNRTMVHLFAGGDDGKNHIVLRAVMDGSGEMHQERDRSGRARQLRRRLLVAEYGRQNAIRTYNRSSTAKSPATSSRQFIRSV